MICHLSTDFLWQCVNSRSVCLTGLSARPLYSGDKHSVTETACPCHLLTASVCLMEIYDQQVSHKFLGISVKQPGLTQTRVNRCLVGTVDEQTELNQCSGVVGVYNIHN